MGGDGQLPWMREKIEYRMNYQSLTTGEHCKTNANLFFGNGFSIEPTFLSLGYILFSRLRYCLQFKNGTLNHIFYEFSWVIKMLLSELSINMNKNVGIYSAQRVYDVLVGSYNLFLSKLPLATFTVQYLAVKVTSCSSQPARLIIFSLLYNNRN